MLFEMAIPPKFILWFEERMKENGLKGSRDTSKFIGISHPVVSDIRNNEKLPSYELIEKIAHAFKTPFVTVLMLAGVMPDTNDLDPFTRKIIDVASRLGENEKHFLLGYLEYLDTQSDKET